MTLDVLSDLPKIGSEVSLIHPQQGCRVEGEIITYTCSEDFEHVDGVNVLVDGNIIECHLYDVDEEVC